MERKMIVTMPPYAPYLDEVLSSDYVSGIRLNTVMPLKESKDELIDRLYNKSKENGKDLWVDLKCRQLRVKEFGTPPYTEVKLSHKIEVYTPCKAYFSDRAEAATILEVDGDRLIMQDGPRRVVGPGESLTITHPTLNIHGYLTESDKEYIEASKKAGLHKYMLSFFEGANDFDVLKELDSEAEAYAKIESVKGMNFVRKHANGDVGLMAARGDLFLELHWPHKIAECLEEILEKDKNAIAASRILSSLAFSKEPNCSDIGDLDNLLRMGYKNFMLGDEVCLERNSVISAINLFGLMVERYQKR